MTILILAFLANSSASVKVVSTVVTDANGEVQTTTVSRLVDGDLERVEIAGVGRTPPITTIINRSEGTVTMVSDRSGLVASVPQSPAIARALLAGDLALDLTKRGVREAEWFQPLSGGEPRPQLVTDKGTFLGHETETTKLEMWVEPSLPLGAVDFAKQAQTSGLDALVKAMKEVPGFPVYRRVTTELGKQRLVVTETVTSMEVDPARVEHPTAYKLVDPLELIVGEAQHWVETEGKKGLEATGLGAPFVATPEQPVPPPLPSGWSCQQPDGSCWERWEGLSFAISERQHFCEPKATNDAACDRSNYQRICVSEDRTFLHYATESQQPSCSGEWLPLR